MNDKFGSTCRMAGVRRRGTILITAMTVCFALATVVFMLSRKMAVESIASANQVAQIQADAVERGAEQYVLGLLNTAAAGGTGVYSILDTATYPEEYFAAVRLGQTRNDGYFWILRPVYDGDELPLFGLVDECSKIDINYPYGPAPTFTSANAFNIFLWLPGMTEEAAAAIVDWRDADQDAHNIIGAETAYYSTLPDPYNCKDAEFESIEELLLVRDLFPEVLYGGGTASPLGMVSGVVGTVGMPGGILDPLTDRGWYDLLTIDSFAPPTAGGAALFDRGKINVNTAPRGVLYCWLEGDAAMVDALVSLRQQSAITGGSNDITWAGAVGLPAAKTAQMTGESYRYSADILAVSADGKAFKRVRIVIDTQYPNLVTGVPEIAIISRKDLTDRGWPMDEQILASIRAGMGPPDEVGGSRNSMIGGTAP